MLTSTVMVPIYGKLSDIFGRKPIFLIGVVVFLVGSAASGAAQSMNELIAFGPQGKALYAQLLEAVKVGLTSGIHNVFVLSTVLMCVGFVAIFFLKEIPLLGGKRTLESSQAREDAAEGTSPAVIQA